MADYALIVDEGVRLFLTHGHIYNEQHMPAGRHDVFVYGHTHLWKLERCGSAAVCNLGSITFPKGGNEPTFAVYEHRTLTLHRLDGTALKRITL